LASDFCAAHFHETRHAARDRGARLGMKIALVFETGFTKVHLIVDHAGQQESTARVENAFIGPRVEVRTDLRDAPVADAHIAGITVTFVDDIGVDDQRGGHGGGQSQWRRSVNVKGTSSIPPRLNGWQRARRHSASSPPRPAPKRATATRA